MYLSRHDRVGDGRGPLVHCGTDARVARGDGLPIDQIAIDDARRIEFNNLHGYSVNALGLAMIAALVAWS
jgi:hypothetical protein